MKYLTWSSLPKEIHSNFLKYLSLFPKMTSKHTECNLKFTLFFQKISWLVFVLCSIGKGKFLDGRNLIVSETRILHIVPRQICLWCSVWNEGYDTDSSNPLSINSRNSSGFSPSTSENYSPQEARNPAGVSQLRPLNNSAPAALYDSLLLMLILVHLAVN